MVTHLGTVGPIAKPEFVALVGPPSCGKTTLVRSLRRTAECVSRSLQIADFSRHIRAWHLNLDNDSPLRELALSHEAIRSKGNMIPDEEMEKLILGFLYAKERLINDELMKIEVAPDKPSQRFGISRFICAGWPRNEQQIKSMRDHFRSPMIVLLDLTYEKSNEMRLKRIEDAMAKGESPREDDLNVAAFENRWLIYNTVTKPALDAWTGRLVRIDSGLHLKEKTKIFIRECIPADQHMIRASMFSKFLPHPKNEERGCPRTEATKFIDHIELGIPLQPKAQQRVTANA